MGNRRSGKRISNVRVLDRDETSDSLKVSSILSSLSASNSQVRVVCGYSGTLSPQASGGGTVSLAECQSTDDWAGLIAQYREFRVRAIQFRIFDVQPNSAANVNFWATFHQITGSPDVSASGVVDRPDARSIAPGAGYTELVWLAHGQPEMEFQSTTTANDFGGLVYNNSPAASIVGTKYTVVAKFIVDFRART